MVKAKPARRKRIPRLPRPAALPAADLRNKIQYVRLNAFERAITEAVAQMREVRTSSIFRILVMEEARRLRIPLRRLRASILEQEKNLAKSSV